MNKNIKRVKNLLDLKEEIRELNDREKQELLQEAIERIRELEKGCADLHRLIDKAIKL